MLKRFKWLMLSIFFVLLPFSNIWCSEEEIAKPVNKAYTLTDLCRIALESAEDIKIKKEDIRLAQRGRDKALSLLLPTLSASGNYTTLGSRSLALILSQSFSLGGSEVIGLKISEDNIRKSEYDLLAAKEDYLLNVSSSYFDLLKAEESVEIADANVKRLTKYRNVAGIMLKVGEVTKTVLLRAEAELSSAQSDLIRAQNALKLIKFVLASLVGLEGEYDVRDYDIEYKAVEKDILFSLKAEARERRDELKSAALQMKMAEYQVKTARSLHWPIVSMEATYSKRYMDPEPDYFVDEYMYGGVRLSIPIFEGGLRRAEVREAVARLRLARLAERQQEKNINIEVERVYLDFITQRRVLRSLEDQLVFAKDNYNAVSKQFEFGLASSIDVMDANTLLVTTERQFADARYSYQLSILKLKRATGTLLETIFEGAEEEEVKTEGTKEEGN